MTLKRISHEEASFYTPLDPDNHSSLLSRAVAFTLTPCDDAPGWEEITYYSEALVDPSFGTKKTEWIYVLVNKSYPGICKIGMTTTTVDQRVKEINSATGVITPWYPVYRYKCLNSYYLEQDIHSYLEKRGYRVNPRREGFEIDSSTAISVINMLGEKYSPLNNRSDSSDSNEVS